MKSYILLLLLFLGVVFQTFAQNKRDYKWLFGSSPYVDLMGVEGNVIDFNNKGKIDTIRFYDSVASNNANISDLEGNLLFYFTGCRIIDSTQQIMENGDSINYGEMWEDFCGRFSRYPGTQNSIVLPDPGYENGYYLIHKRLELITEPPVQTYTPELYYSYIDIAENDGRGKVLQKNHPVFRTSNLVNGYLTACMHENEEDWWLIQMKRDTNIYFKILLSEDTIMAVDSQSIGPNFSINSNVGQAVFSPDGSKWLSYDDHDGALIYDFDRKTGILSNFRHVFVQDSGRFVGVAVSSNSRFAYLCSKWDLYQVDLWADDIQSTLTHIDHWDGFTDPTFACTFNQAQLAPDCKIYIVSSATNNYLHVINKPNEKGKACDFRQHSLYLPNRNYNNSIPNFPHFRIDEEEVCDSTISWIPELGINKPSLEITIFPNPVENEMQILKDYGEEIHYEIYNILGNKVEKFIGEKGSEIVSRNVKTLKEGSFILKAKTKSGKFGAKKFIIQ